VSDFVAGRVEARLRSGRGTHVYTWFDPRTPTIPSQTAPSVTDLTVYQDVLRRLRIKRPSGAEDPLNSEQQAVALAGLCTRIQLLQGPPGTGKTQTTAAAILLRILARRRPGVSRSKTTAARPGDIVLIAAHTHNAVDELLTRLFLARDPFIRATTEAGRQFPYTVFAKVFSSADQVADLTVTVDEDTGATTTLPIQKIAADACAAKIKDFRKNGVLGLLPENWSTCCESPNPDMISPGGTHDQATDRRPNLPLASGS
jgi:hypothetical protein